ncbi:hypothetical protein N5D52_10060 [Pseudomonas sp. GD03860]|uniref:hypothetical protein n=1 Tax=Pseudomonas TaxID=286 RepID=UPI0023640211|nr:MULTISPECIES: hypothetical protein [Pseudomonas]MDD2056345.1 hypothetical protein [Pseudomonas putida]MDH0637286.1 hypothetical protein [Pseudomonas sp. GD03860]
MDEKTSTTADTLELLLLNQVAIRAAIEELSLSVSRKSSLQDHENILVILATLDIQDDAIREGIERLRG